MKVNVYTIPNCGFCVKMKDGLKERGIEFTEVDVSLEENDDIFKQVVEISGTESVPTVIVGTNLIAPDVNFYSIEQGLDLVEHIMENEDE
jgi:glutaredoxin